MNFDPPEPGDFPGINDCLYPQKWEKAKGRNCYTFLPIV